MSNGVWGEANSIDICPADCKACKYRKDCPFAQNKCTADPEDCEICPERLKCPICQSNCEPCTFKNKCPDYSKKMNIEN